MSDISTIYDNLASVCGTTLSTYTEIPWPYRLNDNPVTLLHKGWGIGVTDGIRANPNELYNLLLMDRLCQVILTNQATYSKDDASNRRTQEKTFLEDLFLIIKAFELPTNWPSGVIDISYVSDDGITYQEFENGARIMSVVINFQYRYEETVT